MAWNLRLHNYYYTPYTRTHRSDQDTIALWCLVSTFLSFFLLSAACIIPSFPCTPEAQKPKTVRMATFYVLIHFSRHIKKACNPLSRHISVHCAIIPSNIYSYLNHLLIFVTGLETYKEKVNVAKTILVLLISMLIQES